MPFRLNFHVEDRTGVMVVVFQDGAVRPATSAEVELWNIITKRFSSTRESYIRVSEQDFLELLREREHLRAQVTELQAHNTKVVLENRELRALRERENGQLIKSDSGG
jgi:hypothetical protein